LSYRQQQAQLADHAEAQIGALHAAYAQGKVDRAGFTAAAVALLAVVMEAAVQQADQALADMLAEEGDTEAVPTGVVGPDAEDALTKAVSTVLDGDDPEAGLGRLARWRVFEAGQFGWGDALQRQPNVTGWTRQARGGACATCRGLTGPTLPLTTPIWHHQGCQCVQKPVPA
jgi:hypothetical protein